MMTKLPTVRVIGHPSAPSGMGEHARGVILSLAAVGIPVEIVDVYRHWRIPPAFERPLAVFTEHFETAKPAKPIIDLYAINADEIHEPSTFADVAYFRDDFAAKSLDGLIGSLKQEAPPAGPSLPGGMRWAGVWIYAGDLKGRIGLDMQVRDATGRLFVFTFGPEAGYELQEGAWTFLYSDLSRPSPAPGGNVAFAAGAPQGPYAIVSVAVRFLTRVSALTGSMQLDELQVSNDATLRDSMETARMMTSPGRNFVPFAASTVVSNFDTTEGWAPLRGVLTVPLNDQMRNVPAVGGGSALELSWRPVQGQPATHGLRPRTQEDAPLPVLASEAFLNKTDLKVGDVTASVPQRRLLTDAHRRHVSASSPRWATRARSLPLSPTCRACRR